MAGRHGAFWVRTAVLTVVLAACSSSGDSSGPGSTENADQYLASLPSWDAYSPRGMDTDSTVDSTRATTQTVDTLPVVSEVDSLGNLITRQNVAYSCTSVPYTITRNPTDIVMYNPDQDILWPGALIQGKTRKASVGGFLPLTIAERAPVNVSIPGFATGTNFRKVDIVDQAHVDAARGDIVGDAVANGLEAPSASTFEMRSYNSEQEFALQAGLSGRNLGFKASASGSTDRTSAEHTVAVHFYQRMFDVVVAPPQTPGEMFSSAFTQAKLQQQINAGTIGPDNLPIYVSQVSYGRMMMFALTSSASESDIRATLNASYKFVTGQAGLNLDAKQHKILEQSKIAITTRGGNDSATAAMIRTGDWRSYFTASAKLSTAAPLSYTFRNLGDGSIANVTESTNYAIKTCAETSTLPAQFTFRSQQAIAAPIGTPFETRLVDVNGDGRADLVWNHRDPSTNEIAVALGQADGSFGTPTTASHPETPSEGWGNYTLQTGDFDGDGKTDLAWNYLGSVNKTYVALSTGTAWTFAAVQQRPEGGWTPFKVLVGDTDGDGDDDLIFNVLGADNGTYVSLSNGDGTFDMSHPAEVSTIHGWGPYVAWMGDVNKDGREDLIWNGVGSSSPNRTYAGTFQAGGFGYQMGAAYDHPTSCCWTGYQRIIGDFNGDGAVDIALSNKGGGAAALHMVRSLGTGAWTAGAYVSLSSLAAGAFTAYRADINGDGIDDLVFNQLGATTNNVHTALGKTNGVMEVTLTGQTHPASTTWSNAVTLIGDVNDDGRDDVVWVIPGATVQVYVALARP
jgi:Thiol-activated cytolysin/FG-GAP-like repeat